MDVIIKALLVLWPFLHVLAAIAILVKAFLIFASRGFDLPKFVMSFFRIYNGSEIAIQAGKRRATYMIVNNVTNFYLYAWVFITVILFMITGSFIQ